MPESAKGVRFITATSHRGRQMRGAKGSVFVTVPLSPHNAEVERKRAEKLALRKAKK